VIYCDTAYLLKYYVDEPGSAEVRALIDRQTGVGSLSLGRLELSAAFHRKWRERQVDRPTYQSLVSQFRKDNDSAIWTWFESSRALIEKASDQIAMLSPKFFLRASDALHLVCAKEYGFREIHSNDRHLLAAAKHFDLKGCNVIRKCPTLTSNHRPQI